LNETLRNYLSRLNQMLGRFTPTQRRNIAIAAVSVVLCLVVILWFVTRPNYVTVMSGLDNKSLGEVQAKLQDLKIPNEIQGSSVLVPAADADTARVQLAMAGLPKSGYIGYGNISNSFGMTQDMLNIQVLDALQQSLDQTIESIDGIDNADVHIVMPDQQLFVSQPDNSAKASVFVQLAPGVQLSGSQVAGIQQLVSHAVKGLTPDNVSVIDQNGVALSAQDGSGMTGMNGAAELAARQQIEQQMTAQLTDGLNRILGPGNVIVMVHANVSFDKVHSQSHIYQPAPGQTTGLPSSSQIIKRSSSNSAGNGAGGIAGQSSSNPGLPTYAANSGQNSSTANSTETDVTTNYDNSYIDTTTDRDPVTINGISVGVLVNSANRNVNQALINQIKSFVSNALGITTGPNAQNGISVAAVPFQSQSSTFGLQSQGSGYLTYGAIAAGVAALIGGAAYWRKRREKNASQEDGIDQTVIDENPFENIPLTEDERMKMHLGTLATQRPEEFASLLRGWLNRE
jgi:flagellar M-ring protein FliF